MSDPVYISGHRNPDTDSICSVIAYADLKKKLGVPAVPVRIGNINRETAFVLNYFGVEAPEYLESVRTQVSDLNMDSTSPISADVSVKAAWSIMQKSNVKVLPVSGDDGRLMGIVTLSDITRSYMDALESNLLSSGNTPLHNITDTLKAKLISGSEGSFQPSGKVVIAAAEPDRMDSFLEQGDIVLTGNRRDTQQKAVEAGASCLVLTCSAKADPAVLELAEKNGCVVMETDYDTFAAARLIDQSVPVGFIMTKGGLISFQISDYIDSIKDKMLQTRYRSYPVVDDDGFVKGFISRYHLISQRRKKIILLDHNEKSQTIDGIEQAEILEVIDHHRIGDIQTENPVYFRNDAVGSTSTLIAGMYFEHGIRPPKAIAGILCAAILSDTLQFRSPTSTYADTSIAEKLAEIAGISIEEFSARMFEAGSALEGMSPEEILNYDFKEYTAGQQKFGIGQVNSYHPPHMEQLRDSLLQRMQVVLDHGHYDFLLLIVTDLVSEGSFLLYSGDCGALIRKAFGAAGENSTVYLKGVVSRKKQIVPRLLNAIKAQPERF